MIPCPIWREIRDRDRIYGRFFQTRVANMGIEEVGGAPRSPRQNPYAERVNGSIRRECLLHVIVLNERHLKRILCSYICSYIASSHEDRTHLSRNRNSPVPREMELPERGTVIAIHRVGGLHHPYRRTA